jgi:hypothetical protein
MKRVKCDYGFVRPICGKYESEGLSLAGDCSCEGTVPK